MVQQGRQVLQEARRKMGLAEAEAGDDGPRPVSSDEGERRSLPGKIAARCWALLLARILGHIGEPTEVPAVLPVRSPPQGELSIGAGVDAAAGRRAWPEIDQAGGRDYGWG